MSEIERVKAILTQERKDLRATRAQRDDLANALWHIRALAKETQLLSFKYKYGRISGQDAADRLSGDAYRLGTEILEIIGTLDGDL